MKKRFFLLLLLAAVSALASCSIVNNMDGNSYAISKKNQNKELQSVATGQNINFRRSSDKTEKVQNVVQPGDLVSIYYSLSVKDGDIIASNKPDIPEGSRKSVVSRALEVCAGEKDLVPGIHKVVIGMKAGEKKHSILSPEDGYGIRKNDKMKTMPSIRNLLKQYHVSTEEYKNQFKSSPVKGSKVWLTPYFPYEITMVSEKEVILNAGITKPAFLKESFGKITITPRKKNINITLKPEMGAIFKTGAKTGRIISISENDFTVDFNSPFAGETLVLDLEVISFKKAAVFESNHISWFNDYDKGMNSARKEGMPVVLILYADWCQWCEKLFGTTLKDPRITNLKNKFIWIKASEALDPELIDSYNQESFPGIVLIGKQGKEIEKLSGYQYAPVLREKLKQVLDDCEDS